MADAARSLRRVRWAQVILYSVIGLALVATAVQSWVSARGVARLVAVAQGRRLVHAVRRAQPLDGPISVQRLERVLAANREQGLRCIAVFDRRFEVRGRVGECVMSPLEMSMALGSFVPDRLLELGSRFGLIDSPPPPRPGGPRGEIGEPPFIAGDAPPPDARLRPGPILVEFEPVRANALADTIMQSVVVALAAVVALLVATIVLWRLSRRAEALQAQAEADRRLVTLGEMSAVLAHEIRNPLAALKGHAQLLTEQLAAPSREHDKAERVVREAVRLEKLTEDLLNLVRANRVESVEVDPASLLREAADSVGREAISVDASAAPARWRLDPARIHQVLVNLLRNAVDASPPGTLAEASVAVEEGGLVFRVRDHGPGVPVGEEERIFAPFFTTRVRGTGLGLAVARRIVELHGGRISARNHPGGGAELRVVVP